MSTAVLALGSNLGDRLANLQGAVAANVEPLVGDADRQSGANQQMVTAHVGVE